MGPETEDGNSGAAYEQDVADLYDPDHEGEPKEEEEEKET